MKKSAFLAFSLFFFASQLNAQVNFGIKAGLSTEKLDMENVSLNDLDIAIKEAKYGLHFGVFVRGSVGKRFYIQPEVLFNSNSVDFKVNDLSDGLVNTILTEKYQNLDIPLMLGLKFGPLRLQGGPVGHVHLASSSELGGITGFESRFNDFNLGYQAGFGLDIWKITLDAKYEGNFSNFGDHITVGGEPVKFSQNPSRWIFSAGFCF